MHVTRRSGAPAIFLLVAVSVYVAAFYIRGILATVDSPDILAGGIAADMVLVVPLAFYLLVVRPRRWPAISVVGVFVLSLIAASYIIPAAHQTFLKPLKFLAAVAELAVLGFIIWKATVGVRAYRRASSDQENVDPLDAMCSAALDVLHTPRAADMAAFEIGVFYYALGSWRARPTNAPDTFTSYKLNNYGSTLVGIGVVLIVELIGVHLLVQHFWSTTAAWVLSALSVYAGLWLLGDWQALRLRPTIVDNGELRLRTGMRWEIVVPLDCIDSIRRVSAIEDKPRDVLNTVSFGDPMFEITTTSPVEARGAYGIRRRAEKIWFTVDDPNGFLEAIDRKPA